MIPEENSGLLAVDVGGGTQDLLVYTCGSRIENCPKMVMPSPTRVVAKKIAKATAERRPVFLFGDIMGGGSCTRAAREHISSGLPLYATAGAALTFNDDLKRVEELGIVLTDSPPAGSVRIRMADIDGESIARSLSGFEVEMPGRWAVAVQDHGHSPGRSNREARFEWYRKFIDAGGRLGSLAFTDVPEFFTRMLAVKRELPGAILMDTGAAAILGTMLDEAAGERRDEGVIVVNVGNYHVMCAMLRGEEMVGLFEHHTSLLDPSSLWNALERFRNGRLSNEEVLSTGGHGCHTCGIPAPDRAFRFVVATGPNRGMLKGQNVHMAIPHGDIMLTGCFGLIEAARKLGIVRE